MSSMMKKINNCMALTQAAVRRYDMIEEGDHISVGLSGGKDSLLLVFLLARLRDFYEKKFTLSAITIDPCFYGKETDFGKVSAFCDGLQVNHHIKRSRLWEIVFEERKESNPCSLCARMRRGSLHQICEDIGSKVIALGHHKDDAAETFLMNLLNGGTIGSFSPKSYLSRRDIHMIRPMIFLEEDDVVSLVKALDLPTVKSNCPVDCATNREKTKQLIKKLDMEYGGLADKITKAMQKEGISRW